uniref:Uncharacterized protein n=1 Tax=Globodera rostochiensis TaxID=31243 RepID=A0A914HKR0_GLORO
MKIPQLAEADLTEHGIQIIDNFLRRICSLKCHYVVGATGEVLVLVSGGVDSTGAERIRYSDAFFAEHRRSTVSYVAEVSIKNASTDSIKTGGIGPSVAQRVAITLIELWSLRHWAGQRHNNNAHQRKYPPPFWG